MLKRCGAFVGAGMFMAVALTGPAAAAPLPSAPVVKQFTVLMTKQLNVVITNGSNPAGVGQVAATSPTSFKMTFPAGPGTLTLTPTISGVAAPDARCTATSKQSGTFSFTFTPTAQPGFAFGGSGGYVEYMVVTYERHGKRCDSNHVRNTLTIIDAGATELHAVG